VIAAAGLLVLLGVGLFVGALVTDVTVLYWACVAACALAAVLLLRARLAMGRADRGSRRQAPDDRDWGDDLSPARRGRVAADPDDDADAAVDERGPRRMSALERPPVGPTTGGIPRVPSGTEHRPPAAGPGPSPGAPGAPGGPSEEDVEVTDLLLVVDLRDEVLVVDGQPRFHLAECPFVAGGGTVPLPVAVARADGFGPCGTCRPVQHLADAARARRSARD
jgi:hypothetical protein